MRCLLDKVKVNNLHYCLSPLERAFAVATPVVRLKLRQTKPEGMSKTHRRTVIPSHSFKNANVYSFLLCNFFEL